jgi:hypothetical protein
MVILHLIYLYYVWAQYLKIIIIIAAFAATWNFIYSVYKWTLFFFHCVLKMINWNGLLIRWICIAMFGQAKWKSMDWGMCRFGVVRKFLFFLRELPENWYTCLKSCVHHLAFIKNYLFTCFRIDSYAFSYFFMCLNEWN